MRLISNCSSIFSIFAVNLSKLNFMFKKNKVTFTDSILFQINFL
ncbi:hypothetical protein J537_1284 [Acinetobacter baumannii 1437282]|nr:hypothetical protein J537_1284 [Acinetobacter baumannii 1437282]